MQYKFQNRVLHFALELDEPIELVNASESVIAEYLAGSDGEIEQVTRMSKGTSIEISYDYDSDEDDQYEKPSQNELKQNINDTREFITTYLTGVKARLAQHAQEPDGLVDSIGIFVSHASADRRLAQQLVSLLERSLHLSSNRAIRCTSLSGYSHAAGSHTSVVLRSDIEASKYILGLITPRSRMSDYVLFELGASWGLQKRAAPILVGGVDFLDLPGPIREMNAIRATNQASIWQLLEEISQATGFSNRPASIVEPAISEFIQFATNYALQEPTSR